MSFKFRNKQYIIILNGILLLVSIYIYSIFILLCRRTLQELRLPIEIVMTVLSLKDSTGWNIPEQSVIKAIVDNLICFFFSVSHFQDIVLFLNETYSINELKRTRQ